jgi:hypothetical protein
MALDINKLDAIFYADRNTRPGSLDEVYDRVRVDGRLSPNFFDTKTSRDAKTGNIDITLYKIMADRGDGIISRGLMELDRIVKVIHGINPDDLYLVSGKESNYGAEDLLTGDVETRIKVIESILSITNVIVYASVLTKGNYAEYRTLITRMADDIKTGDFNHQIIKVTLLRLMRKLAKAMINRI